MVFALSVGHTVPLNCPGASAVGAFRCWRSLVSGLALIVVLLGVSGIEGKAEPLVVTDANGRKVRLLQDKTLGATVLLFVTNDCPITNSYAPEINRLLAAYTPKHIAFYLVYADPALSAKAVRVHLKEYGYSCQGLLDPAHILVKWTGASITPEAVLLDPNGKRLYKGRIDNRYIDFGNARYAATVHDLRDALDARLHGRPVAHATTTAVGCSIPDAPARGISTK